jgi:hypothetical protein
VASEPWTTPEAILAKTRFSYPRGTLRELMGRILVRAVLLIVVLLALFSLWNALHLVHLLPMISHGGFRYYE